MISEINDSFFVIGLKTKVANFCKNCFICSVTKSQRMQSTTQGATKQATAPKQIMSFDIFGSLVPDSDGYKYVYSFIDNFSLFVINIRAKTKTMSEILAAFLQVFAIWSPLPQLVCSDNESGLKTKEAIDFFASFGIRHNPGAAHAHWRLLSEGASIRKSKDFMRTILLTDHKATWTTALALGTIALNQTKIIHGYTPAQLFYGNQKSQNPLISSAQTVGSLDDYLQLVTDKYNKIIAEVNTSRQLSNEKRTNIVNKYRKSKIFEVKQLVWLKSLNISANRAVKAKNLGPFKVIQKMSNHVYKLATLSNPDKCARLAHASH
jgi:hypothetical protein